MLSEISELTPDTRAAYRDLEAFADIHGMAWQVRSTRRTCDEQNLIFARGRTAPGSIVTSARGCLSWHVLGRAFDITLLNGAPSSDYQFLGEAWEQMGGVWGGRFSSIDDIGHFEWHPGVTIEDVCPNPALCEEVVSSELRIAAIPWGGVFAVAGAAAAGIIWWRA